MSTRPQDNADLAPTDAPPVIATTSWSRRLRLPLMLLGPVVVIALATWFYLSGGRFESTDDAYVKSARTPISANVSGRVVELAVHDNQLVKQGDLLYRLDDGPFKIAVQEAQAQLAASRLSIDSLKANYRQRQSDLSAARETLAYEQTEFDRQQRLVKSGIASQAQVDRAAHALADARSKIGGVQQEAGAVVAQLGGHPDVVVDHHPAVEQAQAALDRAKLNLSYTTVVAPTDGIVTRVEELQVGSYVTASTPVFALVSATDIWLEANFKEDQLQHMRVGQMADVKVDSYPDHAFRGRVVSVSPGTGSQFSALPPENATGNWVKVVQRLPVRIELGQLDPAFPLHAGLSATIDVDTRFKRHLFAHGETLPDGPDIASN